MRKILSRLARALFVLGMVVAAQNALTKPLPQDQVPTPLLPWVDWVLFDAPEARCPVFSVNDERMCVWPGELTLFATSDGGSSQQRLQVFVDSRVSLPGGRGVWPTAVLVDGEAVAVVAHDWRLSVDEEIAPWLATGDGPRG
ncbi:MAG: hypothetical protein HOI95_23205 [Chromatiales bacterium]|jgi:hypothetical protein|nr:hypothetical protein [Chromatiales bacterium]